jgi:site-specific DNA-methyltransferase (cytosine-N4-specific)
MRSFAEAEGRHWLAFENHLDYVAASAFRFLPASTKEQTIRSVYESVMNGKPTPRHRFSQPACGV